MDVYGETREVLSFHMTLKNFILALLTATNYFLLVKSDYSSYCAIFNASEASFNSGLMLRDMTVIGNSAEEYLTPVKTWNTTGTWKVAAGCKLKVCDNMYLDGKCKSNRKNLEANATSSPVTWLSAKCECKKECSCKDVHLREFTCARAYVSSRGCNICQSSALYTELKPGSVENFSDEWNENVKSILVRPGCELTIYAKEGLLGESLTFEGSSELRKINKVPGSYQCKCNTYERPQSNELSEDSTLINIPQSLDDIMEIKKTSPDHPGLKAAIEAIAMGRSSSNAYILVLGSSGSGKSSTINILLGQPNATAAGNSASTTSEIIELRVTIPVPELGINNSQLRIIDTPGLGDTRGVEKDAKFLATLDGYLSNHEELKRRKPNLVLIFHKLVDNRFDGESSNFVKMIKGLNSLRDRITDESSNIVFVFSHLCSVSKEDQRNPSYLLGKFRNVIERYSVFPKPVFMTVVENKGRENLLAMVMENFLLPNMEYFPRNLIKKFETITRIANDTIGNAIVRQAFLSSNSIDQNLPMETIMETMVPSNHPKVAIYLNSLNANAFAVNSTEVSQLLQEAFDKMDSKISPDPESLEYLQRYLNLRNIIKKNDVPQTTVEKLELLHDLPADNPIYYKLLNDGLGLTAPLFPGNLISGYGYNNVTSSISPATPFKLVNLEPSNTGYMIPSIFATQTFNKIKINTLKHSSNCKDEVAHCVHVNTLTFKKFQIKLKPNLIASPEFLQLVDSLLPLDQEDYDNVEKWRTFFDNYGTHVITSSNVGGKIDIEFTVARNLSTSDQVTNWKNEVTAFIIAGGLVSKPSFNETDTTHKLIFHGGNPAYQLTDFAKLSHEEFRMTMEMWKKSLLYYPSVYQDEMVPMTQYFQTTWSNDTLEKVNEALSRYLNSTLKYIPPPTTTPDPKVVEELERQRIQQEEEMRRIEEEMKKQEEAENERKRLAELEAIRLQEEAKKLEDERKRLLEEEEKENKRLEDEHLAEIKRLEDELKIQKDNDETRKTLELWVIQENARAEQKRLEDILNNRPAQPVIENKSRFECVNNTCNMVFDF